MKLNYHYFVLQHTGPEWDSGCASSRNIAAYVPAELGEVQLELVVLLGSKA